MERPAPLKSRDVLDIISSALGSAGAVLPSKHFRERMPERNFDLQDALKVLKEASEAKPKWNTNSKTWNYDLHGKDINGEELTIRIAIEDGGHVIFVTGF